jgi:hypothetical protein
MRINHDGKVGIGTTAPIRPLDVHGGGLAITGTVQNNQLIQISPNGTQYCWQFANISDTVNYGMVFMKQGDQMLTLDTSGGVFTGNVTAYSDRRLKTDIERIDNALDKVGHLSGYTFRRTDHDTERRQTGVIAQEVEQVLPEVVTESQDGIKSVAYGNMVGLLIEAIKELHAEVDYLRSELEKRDASSN